MIDYVELHLIRVRFIGFIFTVDLFGKAVYGIPLPTSFLTLNWLQKVTPFYPTNTKSDDGSVFRANSGHLYVHYLLSILKNEVSAE